MKSINRLLGGSLEPEFIYNSLLKRKHPAPFTATASTTTTTSHWFAICFHANRAFKILVFTNFTFHSALSFAYAQAVPVKHTSNLLNLALETGSVPS